MAIFSGKSRESEGVTNGRVGAWQGLAMITDDYTSECNLTSLKRDAFIAFVPAPAGASPGGPRDEERPSCRLQGSSRRSGRLPALPYPPLEQMGCLELVEVCSRGVFPVSASLGGL